MPKTSKVSSNALVRKVTRTPIRPVRIVLENSASKIENYPRGTWAMLKPVDNVDNVYLPCIFLTEPFNCLGKFPDSIPAHHQLPMDPQISDRHCQIRIENVTDSAGVSTPKIIFEDISDVGTMVDGILIKRDNDNKHPSVTVIRDRTMIAFPASRISSGLYNYQLYVTNLRSNGRFTQAYRLIKQLGNGHFSTVFFAKRVSDNKSFAVKILKKPTLTSDIQKQNKMIKSEIQILNSLGHENLIKIYDYYDEPNAIYLVIEYVEDGEFFEFIKERQMTEKETRTIFIQLFNAIKYLHDRKIVHRDLKPENILMPSKEGLRIKVTDFGLSKLLNIDFSTMQTKCGTVSYVAPEVLESSKERSYNKAVDMWSAGVILYACLCGNLPFAGEKPNDVISKIKAGEYSMDSPKWTRVSNPAKNLVCALLTKDPYKRLTVEGALNHQFFKCEDSVPKPIYNRIQESKKSDETSTEDLFFSCVSQFSRMSTSGELGKRSFVTASETIRSYSAENEISSPSASEGSFF